MNSSERFRAGGVYAPTVARRAGRLGRRALYGATPARARARGRLRAAGPKDFPPPDSLPAATNTFRAAVSDARAFQETPSHRCRKR